MNPFKHMCVKLAVSLRGKCFVSITLSPLFGRMNSMSALFKLSMFIRVSEA